MKLKENVKFVDILIMAGSMLLAIITTITIISLIALILISLISIPFYASSYNCGNEAEHNIIASYTDMRNKLSQYTLTVKEASQIPGMMTNDLKKVILAGMEGRYGKSGSKATFSWIKENYPGKINPDVYKKIQQIIDNNRRNFQSSQSRFINLKRDYEINLGYFVKGFFLRLAGYPKIDLNKFTIISSNHANKAFDSKIDTYVNLR